MPLRFSPARGAAGLIINSLSRGPVGAAATIAAGTATAGAAGSNPAVSNSGSSSAATFNFTIPRGADAGIRWLYASSTSMADPSSGNMRFNNATISSVTAIAVSATGSGSDVSDYVATWDDSTNTTKGYLVIREEAGTVAAIFSISAVTDNGAWLQLTVAYVAGSLSLTVADPLYFVPLLIGNKGTDGAIAGSVGTDDNGVPRADGTGGTTLQGSLVAIDDSGNLTPKTNDVGALGTTALKWADLFLASGAVINFNNGNITITHAAGVLTFAGGVTKHPNTGLGIFDTNASHVLKLVPGSDITADRSLTITTGDADRTLTISGDHTLPGGTSVVLAGNQTITGGYSITPNNIGTVSSGTTTPAAASGNYQYYTNNGAHTLAAPSTDCAIDILVTNGASAGSITFSGFTVSSSVGDALTTTNTNKFIISIRRINSIATYTIKALQ